MLNTAANEQLPSLSPDGSASLSGSDWPGLVGTVEHSDWYVIQRRSLHDAWGPPRKVDALSSVGDDNAITFCNHGLLVSSGSDRPGGCGGTDIWSARRTNPHDDSAPQAPVATPVATSTPPEDDDGPTYFEAPSGEKAIIFCSFNRPSVVAADFGDWDIYEVRAAHLSAFGAATLVASVSSKARDTRTALRSDGLRFALHLESTRQPRQEGPLERDSPAPRRGLGHPDQPRRADQRSGGRRRPSPGKGRRTLYSDSDRPGGQGGRDLYVATAPRR